MSTVADSAHPVDGDEIDHRSEIVPTRPDRFTWERKFREAPLGQIASDLGTSISLMRLIGFTLATFSNSDGGSIFPGDRTLCEITGHKDRAIERARNALESSGWVRRVNSSAPGRAVAYELTSPTPVAGDGRSPDFGDRTPDSGDRTPVAGDAPPAQYQDIYQPIHHRGRGGAGGDDSDRIATHFGCSTSEAQALIEYASADPTTHSPVGRLTSVPGYGQTALDTVREQQRTASLDALRALPSGDRDCSHDTPDGLMPTRAGTPRCPQCRLEGVAPLAIDQTTAIAI